MKMGEFDTFMGELEMISGVPRDILDKTPARSLFALRVALDERNTARGRAEKLAGELRRHLPNDTLLKTLLTELGYPA